MHHLSRPALGATTSSDHHPRSRGPRARRAFLLPQTLAFAAALVLSLVCISNAIAQTVPPPAAGASSGSKVSIAPIATLRSGGAPLEVALDLRTMPAPRATSDATTPDTADGSPPTRATQELYIAWGDGRIDTVDGPASYVHRYAGPGRYTVRLLAADGPLWQDTIAVEAPAADAITSVSGSASVDAYLSSATGGSVAYGDQEGMLSGLTVGAEIRIVTPSKQLRLSSEDLNLQRPNVRFELLDPHSSLSVQLRDVPLDLSGSQRRLDDVATFTVRPPELPTLQFVYVGSRQTGPDAYAVDVLRFGLSDRYKAPFPGVDALRWRADLQSTRTSVAAVAQESSGQTLSAQLDGRFSPGPGWVLKPQLRTTLRWDQKGGVATSASQRYNASLAMEHGQDGGSLALGLVLPDVGSGTNEQSLSLRTDRLAPFTVTAHVSRRSDVGTSFGYGVGSSVTVMDGVDVGLGYRGKAGAGGVSNGAEATLSAKLARTPWNVRLQAAGGVQFYDDGRIDPTATLALDARGALAGLDLGAQAALRMSGGAVTGTLDATTHTMVGDALAVDASAGVLLAEETSARANLQLTYDLAPGLAVRLSGEARARFAAPVDTVTTVGLGLRYSFGGQR